MVDKFIFDVDGTLTPSRQKMDEAFKRFFSRFASRNFVYLVTGSDKDKTMELVANLAEAVSEAVTLIEAVILISR